MIRVLITGARGFIASNLIIRLREIKGIDVIEFSRKNSRQELVMMCSNINLVIHLAGTNRPLNENEFSEDNYHLTNFLCDTLASLGRKIPLIFSSSTQAKHNNKYGESKLAAESIINDYAKLTGSKVYIYRLPNVFGKWSKPNYNSVVATFCSNIANGLPVQIDNENSQISLMYIDDLVHEFISILTNKDGIHSIDNIPVYSIKVGDLANQIIEFHNSRESLITARVGSGLIRALYATYLSFLNPELFSYLLKMHVDHRGVFTEILKTKDSGQFSFLSSKPGITRGNHYHHTKSEKFLVISGESRFRFRHIITKEQYFIDTSGDEMKIVETVPGWAHSITNIGRTEMIVMVWANEIFNKEISDTYNYETSNE